MSAGAPVALVTGAGRGIGRAIALRLGADGYRVALNYHVDAASADAARRAVADRAPDAVALQADVTDPEAVAALVGAVRDRFGRLDVVVNNVGPFLERSASETTIAEWQHMIDGNLNSAFYVCHHALPALRQTGGRIVNMGSLNVELARGAAQHAAYNAAKTALVVLTRSLARSEGPNGVRVNMVSPGVIETASTPAAVRRDTPARVPLGRLGRPEEVADAVAYLVSERAGYVTGAVLTVSGGLWV